MSVLAVVKYKTKRKNRNIKKNNFRFDGVENAGYAHICVRACACGDDLLFLSFGAQWCLEREQWNVALFLISTYHIEDIDIGTYTVCVCLNYIQYAREPI